MIKVSKNEKGFTVVEALITVLIIVVIGFGGFYVWHTEHKPKTTASNVATTSSTTPAEKTTTTPLSTTTTTQLLNNFYTQYIAASNSTSTSQTSLIKHVVQQYGTSSLVSYAYPSTGSYSENPIVCAQDTPTSFSVSGVTSTSISAAGTITEVFGSDTVKVNSTVVSQSGNLKIDTITCNPALTPQAAVTN